MPQWLFAMSSYSFASNNVIVCSRIDQGISLLSTYDLSTEKLTPVDCPFTDIQFLRADNGQAVFRGGSPTDVVSYTGTGISGHTATLTGINRAHALALMGRSTGLGIALALPGGATGALTFKHAATGGNEASFSLDAPAAGVAQVLTISNALAAFNDGGEVYDILVIGT
jgi:hypothetical protein